MSITAIDPGLAKRIAERLDEHESYIKQLQQSTIKNNFDLASYDTQIRELQEMHRPHSGFIYLASPYTHANSDIRHERYMRAMWYAMKLLQNRQWVYSPIVHCHEMARIHSLSTDAIFWMDYNFAMLSAARELHVLCLDGWKDSVGVKAEVAFWRHGKSTNPLFVEP